jgi:hypothetical protein
MIFSKRTLKVIYSDIKSFSSSPHADIPFVGNLVAIVGQANLVQSTS